MALDKTIRRRVDSGREEGGFVALPWSVLDSVAYQNLSHAAKSLLMELARQVAFDNNGKLLLSGKYLAKRGWKSSDVITRAKRDMLAAGLIFETVMGHKPNKASWYAVTWRRLDKIKGFDAGAAENFELGAYRKGTPLPEPKLKLTRDQLYQKWRPKEPMSPKPDGDRSVGLKIIEDVIPSHGAASASIAPSSGVQTVFIAPSHGPMEGGNQPSPTPSHGNHLDIPSAAL